ncbi:MAG: hypothetical protein P8L31_00380 [Pseudomonadales bacterium]|jgi:hypothetical protein|nr:hypothetical protein [Pseudomonadales bacterium]
MKSVEPCTHITRANPELETVFVIDAHLQMADGFVRCRHCDAHYLLEMVDLTPTTVLYRAARIEPAAVAKTVRSLTQGSCDINRARSEVFSVLNSATALDGLLTLEQGQFSQWYKTSRQTIPTGNWRDLPCDGSLIQATI